MGDNGKFLWWQTGVDPDRQAEVGGRMIRTVFVWLAVVLLILVVIGIILVAT